MIPASESISPELKSPVVPGRSTDALRSHVECQSTSKTKATKGRTAFWLLAPSPGAAPKKGKHLPLAHRECVAAVQGQSGWLMWVLVQCLWVKAVIDGLGGYAVDDGMTTLTSYPADNLPRSYLESHGEQHIHHPYIGALLMWRRLRWRARRLWWAITAPTNAQWLADREG